MTDEKPPRAYRIETARTVIRCWNPEDASLLKAAIDASREHLRAWMPWASGEPQSLAEQVELLRRFRGEFDLDQDYIYGIFNQDESQVIGGTGLHTRLDSGAREIGYWIHVDYINQGYATEVISALIKVAFELDQVTRVEIHCDPENTGSAAIPRKIGFTHEATLRNRLVNSHGKPRDTMIWTLFADEYPASLASRIEVKAFDAVGNKIL
jgi:RimJ/RimL family protein N-acetyltransferase